MLELEIGGGVDFGWGGRGLAEGRLAPGRRMGDDAVRGRAFRSRNLPFVGGGRNQHHAGRSAPLAHDLLGSPYAAAAGSEEIGPYALARHVLAGGREFILDLRPLAFELFGDHLAKARKCTLAHLGTRDADRDGL